jgi:hypothetical protein
MSMITTPSRPGPGELSRVGEDLADDVWTAFPNRLRGEIEEEEEEDDLFGDDDISELDDDELGEDDELELGEDDELGAELDD